MNRFKARLSALALALASPALLVPVEPAWAASIAHEGLTPSFPT